MNMSLIADTPNDANMPYSEIAIDPGTLSVILIAPLRGGRTGAVMTFWFRTVLTLAHVRSSGAAGAFNYIELVRVVTICHDSILSFAQTRWRISKTTDKCYGSNVTVACCCNNEN
jgi:hypothetical protein